MKGIRRGCSVAVLLALALIAGTQHVCADGSTVAVQIVAVVPRVLSLSLDFSPSPVASVSAYLDAADPAGIVELGNARLFSNLTSAWSVHVTSANGGALVAPDGSRVDYRLALGESLACSNCGTFSFSACGKSTRGGLPLRVALAVPGVQASGTYTDSLVFSIAAN